MPRTASGTEAHWNVHMPLPDDLYRALQTEAEDAGRPANALPREAIAQRLEVRRQVRTDRAILAYAEAMAGTPDDFDTDLEAASIAHLEHEA